MMFLISKTEAIKSKKIKFRQVDLKNSYDNLFVALQNYQFLNISKIKEVAEFIMKRITEKKHYKAGSWKEDNYAGYEFYSAALLLKWGYFLKDDLIIACLLQNVNIEDYPPTLINADVRFYLSKNNLINDFHFMPEATLENYDIHIGNYNEFLVKQLYDPIIDGPNPSLLMLRLANNFTFTKFIDNKIPEQTRKNILFLAEKVYGPLAMVINMKNIAEELLEMSFIYQYPEEYKLLKKMLEEQALPGISYEVANKKIQELIIYLKDYLSSEECKELFPDLKKINSNIEIEGNIKRLYSAYHKYVIEGRGNIFEGIDDVARITIFVDNPEEKILISSILKILWREDPSKYDEYNYEKSPNFQARQHIFFTEDNIKLEVRIQTRKEKADELGHNLYKSNKLWKGDLNFNDFAYLQSIQEVLNSIYQHSMECVYVASKKKNILHALPIESTVFDLLCHEGYGEKIYDVIVHDLEGKEFSVDYENILNDGWFVDFSVSKTVKIPAKDIGGFLNKIKLIESKVIYHKLLNKKSIKKNNESGINILKEILAEKKDEKIILKWIQNIYFNFNDQINFQIALGMGLISEKQLNEALLAYQSIATSPEVSRYSSGNLVITCKTTTDVEKLIDIMLRFGINIQNALFLGGQEGYVIDLGNQYIQWELTHDLMYKEFFQAGLSANITHLRIDPTHRNYEYILDCIFIINNDHLGLLKNIFSKIKSFREKHHHIRDISIAINRDKDPQEIHVRFGIKELNIAASDYTELEKFINNIKLRLSSKNEYGINAQMYKISSDDKYEEIF